MSMCTTVSLLTRRLYFQESPPVSSTAEERMKNDYVRGNSSLEIMTDTALQKHGTSEQSNTSANILLL